MDNFYARARVAFAIAGLFALCCGSAPAQQAAPLNLVFVLDGLRPDSVNAADTPNLYRLRQEGVWFENGHSVFPTVTRVNSASLGTGMYPARHGILGNTIYIPAVDPQRAFTNDNFQMLLKLDAATRGGMLSAPGLVEILERAGRKAVVVSSGSSGGALLLSPKAHLGTGVVISGDFAPGQRVAYPDAVSEAILRRFGPQPKKGGAKERYDAAVDWSMEVLREYVLPELRPHVVLAWMTEPDHTQHALGHGSPEAVAAIRNNDRQIGLVLKKLEALGVRDRTNIIIVSDHGFSQTVFRVNVAQALAQAGLFTAGPNDVVIASSGQAMALHVKDRDAARIAAIVEYLQQQPWCGIVFTAAKRGGAPHEGALAGTFALEYVHLGGHERSPDIVFTFRWSSAPNRFGMRGADTAQTTGSNLTGPVDTPAAGHGGIGPWTVRNTMIAWGPDFKRAAVIRTPTANVDVAPTLLQLLGGSKDIAAMDGRPLHEALASGPDEEQVPVETRALRVRHGAYGAVLQVTETGGKRYIDKAWRE